MIVQDKNGNDIEVIVEGKYNDDIQIIEAFYLDNGKDVPEETIDWIYDNYSSEIFCEWYENRICQAESVYEILKDY